WELGEELDARSFPPGSGGGMLDADRQTQERWMGVRSRDLLPAERGEIGGIGAADRGRALIVGVAVHFPDQAARPVEGQAQGRPTTERLAGRDRVQMSGGGDPGEPDFVEA